MTAPQPFAIDLDAMERASDADRDYFAAHPGERERVRLAVPGELPGVGWVRVVNVAPGVRARLPWTAVTR